MADNDPSSRHSGARFLIGLLVLIGGIGGFLLLASLRQPPPTRPPPVQTPLVRTVTVHENSGPVPVRGHGFVEPRAEIGLAPQVSGKVVWLNPDFVSGGGFKQDEELFRLDPRSYEYSLSRARSELQATRARLDYTAKQVRRTRELVGKGTATEDELDRLLSQKRELEADLAGLEARVDQARLDLEYTSVTAPFTGEVRSERVDLGEYLTPGQEVARIFATDEAEIVVPLGDGEAQLVPRLWRQRPDAGGDPVPAVVTTRYGGRLYRWDGYVHRSEAVIDPDSRTVNVVVRVPRPGAPGTPRGPSGGRTAPPLVPGMYVTVTIQGIQLERFFELPRAAVRGGDSVWTLTDDDSVAVRAVEVVQEADNTVRVTAPDLADGSRVIISDLPVMTEGMKVRTVEGRADGGAETDPAS